MHTSRLNETYLFGVPSPPVPIVAPKWTRVELTYSFIEKIAAFLEASETARSSLVNRCFGDLIQSRKVWREQITRDFPHFLAQIRRIVPVEPATSRLYGRLEEAARAIGLKAGPVPKGFRQKLDGLRHIISPENLEFCFNDSEPLEELAMRLALRHRVEDLSYNRREVLEFENLTGLKARDIIVPGKGWFASVTLGQRPIYIIGERHDQTQEAVIDQEALS